jgi:hypothetical protein
LASWFGKKGVLIEKCLQTWLLNTERGGGHSNAKTTGLYDRRNDDFSVGEIERIGI